MTLTQLNAFVLVARLGSVTAAANALGVSEPAVSQALSALRQHLGDQLVTRGPAGMTLTAGGSRLLSAASQLVDPSGTDPGSATGQLLARLGIPEDSIGVLPNQTAAWAAAADGAGVAPAVEHLVAQQVRRGELSLVELPGVPMEATWHVTLLERQHRSAAASALRRFLSTPEAMHLMRSPTAGVPPSRFRPPVYVTIWS